MARQLRQRSISDVVSATEVAGYLYCPEQWRLSALGNPSENLDSIERGERFHEKTAAVEVTSRVVIRFGFVLVGLAAFLILLFLIGRR